MEVPFVFDVVKWKHSGHVYCEEEEISEVTSWKKNSKGEEAFPEEEEDEEGPPSPNGPNSD